MVAGANILILLHALSARLSKPDAPILTLASLGTFWIPRLVANFFLSNLSAYPRMSLQDDPAACPCSYGALKGMYC